MRLVLRLAAACCAMLALAACGKKGPPLAPYVLLPAAPAKVDARRVGDEVYVTVAVPAQNIDASKPADVRRVEVYGLTADTQVPRTRAMEIASLVATVPIAAAPREGALRDSRVVTPPVTGAVPQGTTVTIRDPLGAEDLVPRALAALPTRGTAPVRPDAPGALRRYYLAVAFSDRGRPGAPSALTEVPLSPTPDPPAVVTVTASSQAVTLAWEPSGGLLGFLLDNALPVEVLPLDDDRPAPAASAAVAGPMLPAGPTRYHVYRDLAPDPLELPTATARPAPGMAEPPQPVTAEPLAGLTFTDSVEFDRERCYVVRAVRGTGAELVEGAPSPRRCITPVDTEPPAAPTGLSAVVAAGAISLIWEANVEPDVAGYLVLRGSTADATLQPLTPAPVVETQFTDATVTPGTRYVYAVVAVDDRVPLPNVSTESPRVEETAR